MIDEREAGFQVEETDRGVVYRLPANLIEGAWFGAVIVAGIGAFFVFLGGVAAASLWIVVKPGGPRAPEWDSARAWGALLMSLPFLAMGLWMVVFHLWVLFGRDEVALDERYLTAIVRVGPFRWRRRVRRDRVGRFTVVGRGKGQRTPGSVFVPGPFAILRAELDRGKSLALARLHPHELLRALADSLARRSALIAVESDDGFGDAVAKVKVAEDTEDPQDVRERPVQPARSNAVLERFDDGLKIAIPREGLSFLWGASWVVVPMTAGFSFAGVFLAISLWGAAARGESVGLWVLFPIPFLAIGIGLPLAIINAIVRTLRITLRDGTLTIDRRGLFGRKVQSWPIDAVKSIAVRVHKTDGDPSPSWSNDLGIEGKDSKTTGFLDYRRKDELEWIATTLREAMGRTDGPAT